MKCKDKNRKRLSRPAQQKLNEKNSIKRLSCLIKFNFTKDDILIHCTYRTNEIPKTYEEVTKDIQNYIRRVKAYREKNGLQKIKYIYIIDKIKKNKWHWYGVMSTMDKDTAGILWNKGVSKVRNSVPTEDSETLAKWLLNRPMNTRLFGERRWTCSNNLGYIDGFD